MNRKKLIVGIIISLVICAISALSVKQFEKAVDGSDGLRREYKYKPGASDEYLNLNVTIQDSWNKALPDGFVIDSHFKDSKFSGRTDVGKIECIGRTVELEIENISEYRINKWSFEYEVPCDMYFNKAWNGEVEIHQYGNENVDTFSTMDLPNVDTPVHFEPVIEKDELYFIPLKKGDKVIYHPSEKEYPLVESYSDDGEFSSTQIGFIVYTEDDTYKFNNCKLTYYVVQSLDDYPAYTVLTLLEIISGVLALVIFIYFIASIRYDAAHKHDMEIISQAIGTFSKFIDSKDRYTNNHSYRVAGYSKLIAKKLKLPEVECENIYYIGLLHDTGKVVIEDEILNKPGRLTSMEYEVIKSHTTKGAELLKDFTAIKDISVGALYHHERYDGNGYPTGLKGEDIPLVARIICVADSYDAMSSNRCYRAQLEKDYILDQLITNKGKQFDPELVDIFLKCIESGEVDEVRKSCIE